MKRIFQDRQRKTEEPEHWQADSDVSDCLQPAGFRPNAGDAEVTTTNQTKCQRFLYFTVKKFISGWGGITLKRRDCCIINEYCKWWHKWLLIHIFLTIVCIFPSSQCHHHSHFYSLNHFNLYWLFASRAVSPSSWITSARPTRSYATPLDSHLLSVVSLGFLPLSCRLCSDLQVTIT